MHSLLLSGRDTETALDVMGHCKAIIWLVAFLICVVVAGIFSFLPPLIDHRDPFREVAPPASLDTIYRRSEISGLSPLSHFLVVWIRPQLSMDLPSMNLSIVAQFEPLSESLVSSDSGRFFNATVSTGCSNLFCDPILVFQEPWVTFYSLLMSAAVQSSPALLRDFTFQAITHSQIAAGIAWVCISLWTIMLSVALLWVAFRRIRPTQNDQWATLALGAWVLVVDGPWLILKYFTSHAASHIFDLAPELFNAAFLLFECMFIAHRTAGVINRFFSSRIIRALFVMGRWVVVLQFFVTKSMPLCTLSLYIQDSVLRIPIDVCTVVIQIETILTLAWGISCLHIQSASVLMLIAFNFLVVEAAYAVRMYVRLFIPPVAVSLAFGADLFYILVANTATACLLINTLPLKNAKVPDEPTRIPDLVEEAPTPANS
jgi:hypothetical protein